MVRDEHEVAGLVRRVDRADRTGQRHDARAKGGGELHGQRHLRARRAFVKMEPARENRGASAVQPAHDQLARMAGNFRRRIAVDVRVGQRRLDFQPVGDARQAAAGDRRRVEAPDAVLRQAGEDAVTVRMVERQMRRGVAHR